ncbi:nitroreductase family protein [Mucilaginibacter mali]|uniref:nitroreductase family protein n=1 Tax=Mucilaginibacter mali TaxID=2740462 RepID=UPI00374358DD
MCDVCFRFEFSLTPKKYGSKSISLTMQNLGAIYQTMYLTATALGLKGCIISNNEGIFNRCDFLQIGG